MMDEGAGMDIDDQQMAVVLRAHQAVSERRRKLRDKTLRAEVRREGGGPGSCLARGGGARNRGKKGGEGMNWANVTPFWRSIIEDRKTL